MGSKRLGWLEAIVDSFMQWPSVETAENEWIGNENHVLAKNGLAKFGVSTYNLPRFGLSQSRRVITSMEIGLTSQICRKTG